jgi:hypothetical protein
VTAAISARVIGRTTAYWAATVPVAAELGLGGVWDITRSPEVREVVERLGYPGYFLVILGIWKVLGMAALVAPGLPLLKEWAYAGIVFADTGAIASHLVVGYRLGELTILVPLLASTVLSWSTRPASRRTPARVS